jgi:hypothetical protein
LLTLLSLTSKSSRWFQANSDLTQLPRSDE